MDGASRRRYGKDKGCDHAPDDPDSGCQWQRGCTEVDGQANAQENCWQEDAQGLGAAVEIAECQGREPRDRQDGASHNQRPATGPGDSPENGGEKAENQCENSHLFCPGRPFARGPKNRHA